MTQRKSISKKMRFEVLKRDKFTCQYCGRSAPEVILEIDHIIPVAKGGKTELLNLVTSCRDCNRGKRDKELSDDTVVMKQKKQMQDFAEKKEQLEMLVKWKEELENFDNEQVDCIEDLFQNLTGKAFLEAGKKRVKSLIKKYSFDEVYTCTQISIEQYYKGDTQSANKAFDYIGRICYTRQLQADHPELKDINYLCKVGESSLRYFDKPRIKVFLKSRYSKEDEDFDAILDLIYSSRNWTEFKERLLSYYGEDEMSWQ